MDEQKAKKNWKRYLKFNNKSGPAIFDKYFSIKMEDFRYKLYQIKSNIWFGACFTR